jgi:hypothetical protein
LAEDLIAGRREYVLAKTEEAFRSAVDDRQFESMLNQMIETYGKPLQFEFKQDELGGKLYGSGIQKEVRKFWYAAKTTKYEKGFCFLLVEVVPDDDHLAISSFAMVTFPSGIPESLK